MRRQFDFWERMDLPGEAFPGQALVEIAGNSRVLIEQHRGVCEYSRERISISVSFGQVQICGSGLELRSMTKDQLVISGSIDAVCLNRREDQI